MAIAPVKKVQLLVHSSLKPDLLSTLQEAGLMHIDDEAAEVADTVDSSEIEPDEEEGEKEETPTQTIEEE